MSMLFAYQTKQGNELLEKLYFIFFNDLQYAIMKYSERKLHFLELITHCGVMSMLFAYQTKQGNELLEKLYFIFFNDLQHAIMKYLSQISLQKRFNVLLLTTVSTSLWAVVPHPCSALASVATITVENAARYWELSVISTWPTTLAVRSHGRSEEIPTATIARVVTSWRRLGPCKKRTKSIKSLTQNIIQGV